MMLLRVAICLILPFLVHSYCPHACSGHGSCGPNDRCTCYLKNDGVTPAWTGADCSLRTCPMNQAWSAKATKIDDARPIVECSNKGNCNRNSGECECYPGYEGVACERTECLNDCSGHGFCYTLSQVATLGSQTYTQAWDADQHVGCVCDSGYRGPDCSLRECPTAPMLWVEMVLQKAEIALVEDYVITRLDFVHAFRVSLVQGARVRQSWGD